jgi:hypothetical protein
MKKKTKGQSLSKLRLVHKAEGGAAGAVVGAAVGVAAGPFGAVTGAVIGGIVGVVTGAGLDTGAAQSTDRERELDKEIGVSGGEIGAPNLEHPPAKRGAYSSASAGAGSSNDSTPAEGPISEPE